MITTTMQHEIETADADRLVDILTAHAASIHECSDDSDIEEFLGRDLEQLDVELLRALAYAVKA